MEQLLYIVEIMLVTALVVCLIYFGLMPSGRAIWSQYKHTTKDGITMEQRKTVEDTCLALISAWEADATIYNQYKDSSDPKEQLWAEEAKVRANNTATQYNAYLFNNCYVFEGEMPSYIYAAIEIIY